jgi:hypothetical protein
MTADALMQPGADPRAIAAQYYGQTGELPPMLADAFKPAPTPKRYQVTVPGPNGQPITKLVTEDELAAGVREYREPREPREPKFTWILRNGVAHHIPESQIQPGDVPYQPNGGSGSTTEGQRRTDGLLSRAQAARQTIDNLESSAGGWNAVAPYAWMQTPSGQQYGQAAKQWIQSVLRDESGAAIGKDEEASYFQTYFRQPGDSAAVIEQKRRARDAAEQAMAQKVGSNRNVGTSAPRVRRYNPTTMRIE